MLTLMITFALSVAMAFGFWIGSQWQLRRAQERQALDAVARKAHAETDARFSEAMNRFSDTMNAFSARRDDTPT